MLSNQSKCKVTLACRAYWKINTLYIMLLKSLWTGTSPITPYNLKWRKDMTQARSQTKLFFSVTVFFFNGFLISCATAPPPQTVTIVRTVEKERIIKKPFNLVWQSAVEWFATHNMPIKNIDKDSGLLTTEYKLSTQQHMDCNEKKNPNAVKTEITDTTGIFNVLIKKVDRSSTKVSVNTFFSANLVQYKYENNFSWIPIFWYDERVNCTSTGVLEKQILDFISAK